MATAKRGTKKKTASAARGKTRAAKDGRARAAAATAAPAPPSKRRKAPPAKAAAPAAARRKRAAAPADEGPPPAPGTSSLVIVESPAKARTIGKYLGRGYRVKATIGHVRDLPQKKMGIDLTKGGGFTPEYVTIPGKEKTLAELKEAANDAKEVFLATDPDREGEAIAWHVAEFIRRKGGAPMRRVLFHEITKEAIKDAIAHAGKIDEKKVDAQQARRLLDRIVGYKASPILWKTVKKGLSAGRVQTVALRLLVEREREIRAFKPVEYWTIEANLQEQGQAFVAKLHHVGGNKPEIGTETQATTIVAATKAEARKAAGPAMPADGALGVFPVSDVKRRERRKNPSPPFTTSTLQQEAAKKLGFGSKRTMRLAQDLYEGIELGDEGAQGLITYMRTDSTRVAESAAEQAREVLRQQFGAASLADGPQLYLGNKAKNTQDAHESIRPTDPARRPELVKRYLKEDQFKLYQLIWQRFMASQMTPAVFDTTTIDFTLGAYLYRSTGSVVKVPGFLAVYREAREEGEGRALEDEQALPVVEPGERVPVHAVTPSQHFTEPPPRFSEASLVKELERLGIGRPSTYATIISTLADRHYARIEQRRFFPTSLGETVEKVMVKQFPDIFNVGFTSEMEQELDKIEDGDLQWQRVLKDFYGPFEHSLEHLSIDALLAEAHDLSVLEKERCPVCGGKLVAKGGFFGPFVACENHPKTCKFTRPLGRERKPAIPTNEKCDLCGAMMVIRHGRSGEFLGCSRFPKCRGTRSMPLGVKCPKDGGDLAQRRSKKRGKAFYGCVNYPTCDYVCWDKPVKEICPDCGYEGAEMKHTKARGDYRRCMKCGNEWDAPAPVVAPEAAEAAAGGG